MKPLTFQPTGMLLLCLLTSFSISAQSYQPDTLKISGKALYTGSEVIVRWAPLDFETWQWGAEHGYRLERRTVKDNGVALNIGDQLQSIVVLDSLLLPLPEAQWESMADTNAMAGVAAGLLYGDSLEIVNYDSLSFTDMINLTAERENRFGFSLFAADNSLPVAKSMGLGYEDSTVSSGKEYVYTISINNADSLTVVKKAIVVIATSGSNTFPAPVELKAMPGDRTVVLSWSKTGLDDIYTSYCVEKSSDGGSTFQPAHDLPLVFSSSLTANAENAHFYDSLAANGVTYVYRVKGKSPFGIMGPYSDTVHVKGVPSPLGTNPVILKVTDAVTDGDLKITWDFPSNLESKITGFDIYRSKNLDSTFVKINPNMLGVSIREFTDTEPYPVNYYKIKSEDENGYELASNVLLGQPKDTIPPAPPSGLSGVCDKNGVVTLTWAKNAEADLMGYRVFMSNNPDSLFQQVTGSWVTDTTFKYTINLMTLTERVYFALKALDLRQNASLLSPSCTVVRPDIIPPAPPNITNVQAEPGKVHFNWALSSSGDVVSYEFQRKPNGRPGWEVLLSFYPGNAVRSFTDSTASVRNWWDYRLLAVDDAGLVSSSKVIKAKPVDNGVRDSIQNFSGQLTGAGTDAARVLLEWDYFKDPDLEGFQIFRGIDTNSIRSYQFITAVQAGQMAATYGSSLTFAFVDYDLDFRQVTVQNTYTSSSTVSNSGGNPSQGVYVAPINPNVPVNPQSGVTLTYQVMAKFVDGAFSPLSQPVIIQIQ